MPQKNALTKTDFLLFLDAPLHLWAAWHDRLDVAAPTPLELRLKAQGRQVEDLAGAFMAFLAGENELRPQPTLTEGPFLTRPGSDRV